MQTKTAYPEPVVGAYIKNRKGDYLLVRSPKWEDGKIWSVCGGHIDIGESISQAVEREVMEEVGLTVELTRVFALFDALFPLSFTVKKHFVFIECECELKGPDTPRIDNLEIIEAQWFPLKKALALPLEMYSERSLRLLSELPKNFKVYPYE